MTCSRTGMLDVGSDLYFKQTIDADLSKPIDTKTVLSSTRVDVRNLVSEAIQDRKHALKFLHLASHINMVETDTCYFVGTGGNGKSTYMNMAIGVTGKDVYQTFSMDQLVGWQRIR